jgi:polyphosphate kinase 2 (PPK2 family)
MTTTASRITDPEKHWKLSASDYEARVRWRCYREAYEEVFERCSSEQAPWYIIPADRKWHRNAAAAGIVLETLQQMNPQMPDVETDLEAMRQLYEQAKAELQASKK